MVDSISRDQDKTDTRVLSISRDLDEITPSISRPGGKNITKKNYQIHNLKKFSKSKKNHDILIFEKETIPRLLLGMISRRIRPTLLQVNIPRSRKDRDERLVYSCYVGKQSRWLYKKQKASERPRIQGKSCEPAA